MAGNPNAETDLQNAEAGCHEGVTPRGRGEKRGSAEAHEAKAHDWNDAYGECASGDNGGAVEEEPNTGKRGGRTGGKEREGQ